VPVAVLSVWQGFDRLRLDQENVRENLRQSAYAAASDELNVFIKAEQLLRTLSSEASIRAGDAGCQARLRQALEGSKFFGNLGRVSADGRILCTAIVPARPTDPKQSPWWNEVQSAREFMIGGPIVSRALGREVLAGVLPLSKADGSFDGTIGVAIDVSWLEFVQRHKNLPRGAVVGLFDKAGHVVASNNMDVANQVFAQGANPVRGSDSLLSATGPKDEAWSLSIAPIIRRDFFVGFAMPSGHLFRFTYVHVTVDLLLPFLMVGLASLAIWSATDQLALRWIGLLQRMAAAYRGGHYSLRPQALRAAPREFRALGETMTDMAQAVQERDRKLRDAVDQKALLIKEVHHRVKNNLQIVMSLLSLQSSRLKDPTARDAIDQARMRVNALALVHRMIYELDRDGMVDLKPLLAEVVEQLHHGFGGDRRGLQLKVEAVTFSADADTAIPLTLFSIEALTNAYKYAFPQTSDTGTIFVTLSRPSEGRLCLSIADNGRGTDGSSEEESTGSRLMTALANQVGGEVKVGPRDGGGTVVELNFPESLKTAAAAGPATSVKEAAPAEDVSRGEAVAAS
jgi:two-component sensor histidine kinase